MTTSTQLPAWPLRVILEDITRKQHDREITSEVPHDVVLLLASGKARVRWGNAIADVQGPVIDLQERTLTVRITLYPE